MYAPVQICLRHMIGKRNFKNGGNFWKFHKICWNLDKKLVWIETVSNYFYKKFAMTYEYIPFNITIRIRYTRCILIMRKNCQFVQFSCQLSWQLMQESLMILQESFTILQETFMILQDTCSKCFFLHNCTIFLTRNLTNNFNDFLAGVTAPYSQYTCMHAGP